MRVVAWLLFTLQPTLGVFAREDLIQLVGDVPIELEGTAACAAIVEFLHVFDGVADVGRVERRHDRGTHVLADEQLALGEFLRHGSRPCADDDILTIEGGEALGNFAHGNAPLFPKRY